MDRQKLYLAHEFPSPKLLFDLWTGLEDLPGSEAFGDLNDFLGRVHGNRLDEEMHVVLVCADLKVRDFITFGDFFADFLELSVYCFREDHSTILGRTDEVVEQHRNIMAFVEEFTHIPIILTQQAAGN